jgi:hypothetical protein
VPWSVPCEPFSADAPLDAVVSDLDYRPGGLRERVLTALLVGPAPGAAGAHSYHRVGGHLPDQALAEVEVVARRQLDPRLLDDALQVAVRLGPRVGIQGDPQLGQRGGIAPPGPTHEPL